MLDLIGDALSRSGFVYQRIDGRKTLEQRREALRAFGEEAECTILLASLGSAAVGSVFHSDQSFAFVVPN